MNNQIESNEKFGKLTDDQKEQLYKIIPVQIDTGHDYYRCKVKLKNGELKDRVYIVESNGFFEQWSPGQDTPFIDIKDVVQIMESESCLPLNIAKKLYDVGESGMGYILFALVFKDGSKQSYLAGNALDFVQLPDGKKMSDIVDVIPHEGRNDPNVIEENKYYWCLYHK